MKKYLFLSVVLSSLLILSCEKNTDENLSEQTPTEKELETTFAANISGYVQKGPFINGTSISLFELDSNLNQTGRSYSTQIIDNKGTFELENIELESPFVEIKADGFYFNEVTGEKSNSQLTLYSLTNISDSSLINVNILSNLEKNRVKYLVKNGFTFSEAKAKAQEEILAIFSINPQSFSSSEYLDISREGLGNAELLAISVIIQSFRTDAEVAELLANISTDIKEDGILDSEALQTDLISQAHYLRLPEVREYIEQRYEGMDVRYEIADFEGVVNNFINNSDFVFQSLVEYPETGAGGPNLLNENQTIYDATGDVGILNNSITAINPKNVNLRLEILFHQECSPGDTLYNCIGTWSFLVNGSGWIVQEKNFFENRETWIFGSDDSGVHDMKINLTDGGYGNYRLYENDSLVKVKEFTW